MVKTEEANSYKEVLCVIKKLVKEDYNKIPNDYIIFLEENCNMEYEFEYDDLKPFNEQEISERAKYILFGIFAKYGATEKQKNIIKNFKENYNNQLEEQKRKRYNPENIFSNKQEKSIGKNINEQNVEMVVYKETIIQKIIKRIITIFKKDKE